MLGQISKRLDIQEYTEEDEDAFIAMALAEMSKSIEKA